MKNKYIYIVAFIALGLAYFMWMSYADRMALRGLVEDELCVGSDSLRLERIDINDVGDYCALFRVDHPSEETLAELANKTKYYDFKSPNALTAYLPFVEPHRERIGAVKWWMVPKDRSRCREWVAEWNNTYRVNLILCDDVLLGYMENTFERKATSGPF